LWRAGCASRGPVPAERGDWRRRAYPDAVRATRAVLSSTPWPRTHRRDSSSTRRTQKRPLPGCYRRPCSPRALRANRTLAPPSAASATAGPAAGGRATSRAVTQATGSLAILIGPFRRSVSCAWLHSLGVVARPQPGWRRREKESVHGKIGRWLLTTSAVFATSLALRSIDFAVCETIPIGTHFLWHLLNAWVFCRLVCGAIDWRSDEQFLLHAARSDPKRVTVYGRN
jgi:hypothetical protein